MPRRAGSGSRPARAEATVGTTDSLTLFMNEIGRHDLLTAAEEVELAKLVERGDAAAKERMINRTSASSSRSRSAIRVTGFRSAT